MANSIKGVASFLAAAARCPIGAALFSIGLAVRKSRTVDCEDILVGANVPSFVTARKGFFEVVERPFYLLRCFLLFSPLYSFFDRSCLYDEPVQRLLPVGLVFTASWVT